MILDTQANDFVSVNSIKISITYKIFTNEIIKETIHRTPFTVYLVPFTVYRYKKIK